MTLRVNIEPGVEYVKRPVRRARKRRRLVISGKSFASHRHTAAANGNEAWRKPVTIRRQERFGHEVRLLVGSTIYRPVAISAALIHSMHRAWV